MWGVAVTQGNGRSTGRRRVVERNGIVFAPGDAIGPAIIDEGLVRLCEYLPNGQRVVIGFGFPGELIGTEFHAPTLTAEAATEVLLRTWPAGHEGFETPEARALAAPLRRMGASAAIRAYRHPDARVAAFLLDLADRGLDRTWDLPISRSDLADYLILSVHTLSRVIARLQRSGIVARGRGNRLTILRISDLRAIVEEAMSPTDAGLFGTLHSGIVH